MVHLENLDVQVNQEDRGPRVQQVHLAHEVSQDHLALSAHEVCQVHKVHQDTKV